MPEQFNLPLLRKAVDWVETQDKLAVEDREWRQDNWRQVVGDGNRCHTAYCLAGYVAEISGGEWATGPENEYLSEELIAEPGEAVEYYPHFGSDGAPDEERLVPTVSASQRAARLLGLWPEEAEELFSGGNTARQIRRVANQIAEDRGEVL